MVNVLTKVWLVNQAKIMARLGYDRFGRSSVAFIDKALKLHWIFTFHLSRDAISP